MYCCSFSEVLQFHKYFSPMIYNNNNNKRNKNPSSEDDEVVETWSEYSDTYLYKCRHPTRDGVLFVHRDTLRCIRSGCIPCAYKLVVQPTTRGADPITFVQNRRPEECIRVGWDGYLGSTIEIKSQKCKILTLGDGDLTFSLSLANLLHAEPRYQCFKKLVFVATTYLSLEQLFQAYGQSTMENTISQLRALGVVVLHEIDACNLASGLQKHQHSIGKLKFDRVIWNFPCIQGSGGLGSDGQLAEIEANKRLLVEFFAGVPQVLCSKRNGGGQVHVTHKTKPPFSHWAIMDRAMEGCSNAAADGQLSYVGAMVFDRSLYPGYENRKVDTGRGKFPTWDAKVFMWKRNKVSPAEKRSTVKLLDLEGFDEILDEKKQMKNKRRQQDCCCGLEDEEQWQVLGRDLGIEVDASNDLFVVTSELLECVCQLLITNSNNNNKKRR